MKVAGITGGIGSGKSTAAAMFEELGAGLIDADAIAREVVEPGKRAWEEIRQAFGDGVLNEDKTLNREAMSRIVFSDPGAREKLEKITHPRIGEEIISRLRMYQERGAGFVLIDAALLVESPATKWIKPVIVVTAPEEERIKRTMKRSGLSEEEVRSRIRAQVSDEERKGKADFVLDNSGSLEDLKRKVKELYDVII